MKKTMLAISCLLLLSITNAQTVVLKIDGMKGESNKQKFKDKTELLGFVMEGSVLQSTSGSGGMSTGKRDYQPVTFLKQAGAISPLLFQAFFTNKRVREVVVEFYKNDNLAGISKMGQEVLDYTITFKNVTIIGFKQFSGPLKNERFDPADDNVLCDEIKFNFQEIILNYKKDNITVQDNIVR